MTVATDARKITAAGNSATRTFSFSPLVIYAATELEVVTRVTATGVETPRTLGTGATNFAVLLTTFPGTGSVDYPAAGDTLLPSTETIHIRRVRALNQETDLKRQGGYEPETLEDQLDKIVHMVLQLEERMDRSLKMPTGHTTTLSVNLPTEVAQGGLFLRLNAALTAFEFAAQSSVSGALSSSAGQQIVVSGPAAGTSADVARADHEHQTPDIVTVATFVYNAQNFI